jgi:flagellar biosynthesis/type III secretory pathway protein FliH
VSNGKIIKGTGLPPPGASTARPLGEPGKVIEQEVLLAHDEARRIVEGAQARARAIVEEAQGEAAAVRGQAERDGWASGLAQWQEQIVAVGEQGRRAVEEARPQLVQLALKVAEKVLRRRLDDHPEAIVPIVEEALEAARGYRGGHLLLRVNPADVPALEGFKKRLLERDPRWQSLEVAAEATMARGGCRIETDFGTIDASVETQLAAIETLLLRGERR